MERQFIFLKYWLMIFHSEKVRPNPPDDHLPKLMWAWVSFRVYSSKHSKLPPMWLVIFSHKWPVTRKMFPFDDASSYSLCSRVVSLAWQRWTNLPEPVGGRNNWNYLSNIYHKEWIQYSNKMLLFPAVPNLLSSVILMRSMQNGKLIGQMKWELSRWEIKTRVCGGTRCYGGQREKERWRKANLCRILQFYIR